jgi:hypothetical protein
MIHTTIEWKYRKGGEHSRGGLDRVPCPELIDLEVRVSEEKSGAVEDCTTDVCHTEFGVRTTDDLVMRVV